MEQYNFIRRGQVYTKDLNNYKSLYNLSEMEKQLTLNNLENLEGNDSSNFVGSISLPSKSKKLCKCGCGKKIIIKKDHKWHGIPKYINHHHLKDYWTNKILKFDEEQKQTLLGSLLGDGSIVYSSGGYSFRETHSYKQKEYLLWKNKFLNFNFGYNKKRNEHHINKGNKAFIFYRELFYPNDKKIVTREILDKLEPLGLAVWFMDDGNYRYRDKCSSIATLGFSLKENQIIQQWLKERFNINCKIYSLKKNYFIRLDKKNTKKFIKIIKPYVLQIPSMIYKIGLDEKREDYAKNKIKIYELKNKERKKEYSKKWFQYNKNKIREKRTNYMKKWRHKNRDYLRNKKYYKKYKNE